MKEVEEVVSLLSLLVKIRCYVDTIYLGDLKIEGLRPHITGDWTIRVDDTSDVKVLLRQLKKPELSISISALLNLYYQLIKISHSKREVVSAKIGVTVTTTCSNSVDTSYMNCSHLFKNNIYIADDTSTDTEEQEYFLPPAPKRLKLESMTSRVNLIFPEVPDDSR